MKIRIYLKSLLETVWQQDKLLFTPEAEQPSLCLRCGQTLDRRLVINALSRYAAVSYTHLDVYKRQLKDIAAALSRSIPSAISFPADPRFLTSLYYGEYEADVFKPDKRLAPVSYTHLAFPGPWPCPYCLPGRRGWFSACSA